MIVFFGIVNFKGIFSSSDKPYPDKSKEESPELYNSIQSEEFP